MSDAAVDLTSLARRASPSAIAVARTVLEQDVADAAWASQVGAALTQADTARLLGKTEQAVSKDPRLLRIRNRDGHPVYPVMQFDGRAQLAGVAHVVTILSGGLEPLTVASWLTARHPALADRRPIDVLRDRDMEPVLVLARRLAAATA